MTTQTQTAAQTQTTNINNSGITDLPNRFRYSALVRDNKNRRNISLPRTPKDKVPAQNPI